MKCPKCNEDYAYLENEMYICPMCFYEWKEDNSIKEYRDGNGNVLENGDTVIVSKDLKVKGSSKVLKQGTKVKNITLVDEDHDIKCKIDGFGAMELKSCFVKKIK